MSDDASAERPFDEAMTELERIVTELERGDLPLEEALAAFEGGIALVRLLNQRLSEAETRVEILTRDAQGALHLKPWQTETEVKE